MRRRDLLAGIAAASTGCLDSVMSDESTTTSSPPNESQLLTSNQPTIDDVRSNCQNFGEETTNSRGSVRTPHIAVGVNEPANKVYLDVEITQQFTENSPANMKVIIGNNSNKERIFSYGPRPLSHGSHAASDANLMADWRDSSILALDSSGCWRSNTELIGQPVLRKDSLTPGEIIAKSYTLLVPKDSKNCMPNGIYNFSANISVGQSEENFSATDLEWGLCFY